MSDIFDIVDTVIADHKDHFEPGNPKDFIDCFLEKKILNEKVTQNPRVIESPEIWELYCSSLLESKYNIRS